MKTYKLKQRVNDDGVLRLELPVGVQNADVEVVVIVQRVSGRASHVKFWSKHERGYEPWTDEEEHELLVMHYKRIPPDVIARTLKRSERAIQARLRKNGIYIDIKES